MGVITSIEKTNLSEAAAEQLLSLIEAGHYKPGDRFPSERELMEGLHIGRSSVREAMQRLAILGVVEVRPGLGTFVSPLGTKAALHSTLRSLLSTDEVTADLLESREILEPHIAELAAQRASEEDLAYVQEILDDTRSAIARGEPVFDRAALFHRALAECTHNAVLVRFMESIMDLLVERGKAIDALQGYSSREVQAHQNILDAIASGDVERARTVLREHIEESTALYMDTVGTA